jgi:hypothetical protein
MALYPGITIERNELAPALSALGAGFQSLCVRAIGLAATAASEFISHCI